MPAYTTRLALYKPGGGSTGLIPVDEVVDIDKINDDLDKIDANLGAARFASTARPATPYAGQLISLTDKQNRLEFWDGTAWRFPTLWFTNLTEMDAAYGQTVNGTVAMVNAHQMPSGGFVAGGLWVVSSSQWQPLSGAPIVATNATTIQELTSLVASLTKTTLLTRLTKIFNQADNITYLYVGAGNTSLRSNAASAAWQAWSKEPTSFSPSLISGMTWGTGSTWGVALWGISEGTLWVELGASAGTGYSLPSTTADFQFTLPSAGVGATGGGTGQYQKGGSTGAGSQVSMKSAVAGAAGALSVTCRIRGLYVNTATVPALVSDEVLGKVVGSGTTADTWQVGIRVPSAAVI